MKRFDTNKINNLNGMGKFLKRYRLLKDDQREKWLTAVCACAKSLQSCLALCNPMDCSLPSSCPWDSPGQKYWDGLPCPPPGDLPNPEIEPASLMPPTLAGGFFTTSITWEVHDMSKPNLNHRN